MSVPTASKTTARTPAGIRLLVLMRWVTSGGSSSAPRGPGPEHRDPAARLGVIRPEAGEQVALLQQRSKDNIDRQARREQEQVEAHHRLRPQEDQQAEHQRVADEGVRPRREEALLG